MFMDVTLEDAHTILWGLCSPVEENIIRIDESAGRILSREIIAGRSIPPFDKSAMDGYAIRAKDSWRASGEYPVRLKVIENVRAGVVPEKMLKAGTAIRIMTGAVIPESADAVIKLEEVISNRKSIIIGRAVKPGENIIHTGDDVNSGELIAGRGTKLTPSLLSVLAGLGIGTVSVYRKVKVAVISTGDELMNPSEESVVGRIYNSSHYGIVAKSVEAGAEPIKLDIAPDVMEKIADKIIEGLEMSDLVVTTGGLSDGDYDMVEDAIGHIGATVLFKGLAIRSGSTMLAALKDGKLIIALSGNPASAMANFDLIVVSVIKKMTGLSRHLPARIQVTMSESYMKNSPTRRLVRARMFRKNGIDYVRLTSPHNRGPLMSMIDSNFMLDIPAGTGYIAAGQKVWGFIVGDLEQVYDESSSWIPVVVQSASSRLANGGIS